MTTPKEKAEALNNFSQFSTHQPALWNTIDTKQHTKDSMQNITVLSQLRKLNPYKATGPDELPSPPPPHQAISTFSRHLINTITDWKKARVWSFFEKNDKYLPSNYRPISLTCVANKILEHIVTSQLTAFLETSRKLTPCEHGYRSRRSCESQLIELTCHISLLMDQEEFDACFLDLSRAFDKVDHHKLICKLTTIEQPA